MFLPFAFGDVGILESAMSLRLSFSQRLLDRAFCLVCRHHHDDFLARDHRHSILYPLRQPFVFYPGTRSGSKIQFLSRKWA